MRFKQILAVEMFLEIVKGGDLSHYVGLLNHSLCVTRDRNEMWFIIEEVAKTFVIK